MRSVPCLGLAAIVFGFAGLLLGQDALPDSAVRIYELDPYDQITLDAANGGGVYKVMPLDFPQRRVPKEPDPNSSLIVRLLSDPTTKAELSWRNIAKIELFEELILREAESLTAQAKFEDAYDHYAFLHQNYPGFAELAASTETFRYRNAGALFQQGKFAEALVLLEDVYSRTPSRPGLSAALAGVTDRLLKTYSATKNYDALRDLLERTTRRGGNEVNPLVTKWREQLAAEAETFMVAAQKFSAERNYREAHRAAQQMLSIWPELPGAGKLAADISAQYPLFRVAIDVERPSNVPLANWHRQHIRRGRLIKRPLVFPYSEAGSNIKYRSPWGTLDSTDDRKIVMLSLGKLIENQESTPATAYELSAAILESAQRAATHNAITWPNLVSAVHADDARSLRFELKNPHPRPLSLLLDIDDSMIGNQFFSGGIFQPVAGVAGSRNFLAPNGRSLPPPVAQEIIETKFADGRSALYELRKGRIDVIERIDPYDVLSWQKNRDFAVTAYGSVSLHALLPNPKSTWLANATFRRALAYGSNREVILRQHVLGGSDVAGCRTVSAPLPAPRGADDPLAYAYDSSIEPYPYEPRLGLTLERIARREVFDAAKKAGDEAPKLKEFTLAHDGSPVAERACAALMSDWRRIGIQVNVINLSQMPNADWSDYDLLYVELQMTEPLVDLPRLLTDATIIPPSAATRIILRRLQTSTNLPQAQQNLYGLHRILHHEQTVIPLFQIVEHFAIRNQLRGVKAGPHSLYQDIEQWRISEETPGN